MAQKVLSELRLVSSNWYRALQRAKKLAKLRRKMRNLLRVMKETLMEVQGFSKPTVTVVKVMGALLMLTDGPALREILADYGGPGGTFPVRRCRLTSG